MATLAILFSVLSLMKLKANIPSYKLQVVNNPLYVRESEKERGRDLEDLVKKKS